MKVLEQMMVGVIVMFVFCSFLGVDVAVYMAASHAAYTNTGCRYELPRLCIDFGKASA